MDPLDALYDAAIAGDVDAIAKLEMEADKLDENDGTILHVESRKGNAERVRFILREFASKNLLVKLENEQHTALAWAAYLGHTEVVEVLIDAARHLPPFSPDDDPHSGVSPFQAFLRQGDKDSDTALHSAVIEGNVDVVKLLVEADPADRHTQNDDGKTPMFIAVEQGFNDIVKIISTTCTDPSLDGPYGSTVVPNNNLNDQVESSDGTVYKIMDRDALYVAAISGDADVSAILEMKADILNEYAENILHIESESGNIEHVRFILSKFENKNLLDKRNRFEQTALHLAVGNEHTEVAQVIIEAARRQFPETALQDFLRQGDQERNTALHVAVMLRNVAIVKLLVEADPTDTHTQNEMGTTPMFMAVEEEYNEIVELISTTCIAPSLDGPDGSTVVRVSNLDQVKSPGGTHYKIMDRDALFDSAIAGDADAIAKLEMEADKLDRYDRTILHIKSIHGNTEHVRFILRKFANKNLLVKLGNQQENALAWAAYFGHTEVVEILIEAARQLPPSAIGNPLTSFQAYLRHADQDSETALHAAVKEGCVDAVKLLVEADPADTHIQNIEGKTPMYMAVEKGYNQIVEIISTICTAPSLDGPNGSTALHAAAKNGNNSIEVVKVLIDAARRLPSSAPDNDITESNAVTSFQYASDNDNTTDDDDDESTDDYTNPNRVTSFQSSSSSDNESTNDNPVSSFQAFLRRVDEDGNTALHIAVMQRNLDIAKLLVESDPSYVGTPNKKGQTPFYIAVEKGYADTAKMICTTCTTPHFLYGPGGYMTALHAVIKNLEEANNEVKDVIEMIIDQIKKHNINVVLDEIFYETNEDGYSILEVAVELNKVAVVNLILDVQHPVSKIKDGAFISLMPVIYKAEEKGNKNILDLLTERYIERSKLSKDFKDQVSLISAIKSGKTAHHGHTKVVEALLSAAKRNLPSSSANDDIHNSVTPFQAYIRQANVPDQNTALHAAVLRGDVTIVKLLVEADPNDSHVQNNKGKTPIYIAAENGFKDVVKEICKTCTALSLDGPGARATALHALIQKIGQVTEGASDIVRTIIDAAKRRGSADFEAFFGRTNELGITVLQLAVENNCVDAVRLILQEDPAYQPGRVMKRNGLMTLIFKAIDNECSDDIIKLLSRTYEAGIINPDHKDVVPLILAMKRRDEDTVLRLLDGAKNLVSFTEDNGWTALHYAVYHEFDSVLGTIIGAQEDVKHHFVYEIPTPFHVAIECGHTSTLVRLMQLWPALSSAPQAADKSPYIVVNKDGRNILHLAAADNRKEMVEGILKHCPKLCKDKMLQQQDSNHDTPLHVLISSGCFIRKLIKHQGLDTMPRNKNNFTPWEMLYHKNDVVADQVHIKIALDEITDGKLGPKTRKNNYFSNSTRTRKNDIFSSSVPPSKRRIKDVLFDAEKKALMDKNEAKMKEELERYRQGTNSQIVVSALITTITFTVGFTMPGGLHQSGEGNEGLTVLSKKAAFNAFMIFDAIALLLSACSLFIYFLESMSQNLSQLTQLHATTIVLNIISVVMMMLVFMTGTYVVLSESRALAITTCLIGSLFFVFVIVQLLRVVNDSRVQKDKDHEHEA